jgi:hypothetical protein
MWLRIWSIMPVARKHLRCNLGEDGHLLVGTLHDLRAIDPKKKIEGGGGPLVRQRVEQSLEVVQPAFVEHLTECPNDRAKAGPILLPPGRVTYVGTVAVAVDFE